VTAASKRQLTLKAAALSVSGSSGRGGETELLEVAGSEIDLRAKSRECFHGSR